MRSNKQLEDKTPDDHIDSEKSSRDKDVAQLSAIGLIKSKTGTRDVKRLALARTRIEILAEERALRLAADGLF